MRRSAASPLLCGLVVASLAACGGASSDTPALDAGTPLDAGADTSIVEDGFDLDASLDAGADGALDGGGCVGDAGCSAGARCRYGVCIPDRGTCATNDDCPGDAYCDPPLPGEARGVCTPYGVPAGKTSDDTCKKVIDPGKVAPLVQCEWSGPDATDPTAAYKSVYSTPVVADFNLDLDPDKLRPSIVVTTFASLPTQGAVGMLRVFDGRTCAEQLRIGGPDDPDALLDRPGYGTQLAIGDLDGDVGTAKGHPEIVALGRVGFATNTDPLTLVAYRIDDADPKKPKLARAFRGRVCDPGGDPSKDTPVAFASNVATYAPGIWDLDDDGKPEIVVDTLVFDGKGCLQNPPATFTSYLSLGVIPTIADADHDGKPDLVRHDGIFRWDPATHVWARKSFFTYDAAKHLPGYVAIADLGDYSTLTDKPGEKLPEVAVVSAATSTFDPRTTGTIRVQTLDGKVVFGPLPLFHAYDGATPETNYGGHGGPPTIGDFDGDGLPEIAAAANQFYVVYDPDCTADGKPLAARPTGKCDRSKVTLPAGVAALPAGILWAKASKDFSSSVTGSSIFDFNGDGRAEVVYRDECYLRVYDGPTGDVLFSRPATSGTGTEMPIVADVNGSFASQIVVARAGSVAGCASPDPLFPASGPLVAGQGFLVLRDPLDRWASSRPIWNQHAYSVTNVLDDGRIPKASAVARNWSTPGLDNFRQNVQGKLGALKLADLTVELSDLSALCAGKSGSLTVSARVCNRGTNPVTDGVNVRFSQREKGSEAGAATLVCSVDTPKLLGVGECVDVSCAGAIEGGKDVVVQVDPDGKVADCHPGNNEGASAFALCPTVK